MTDTDHTIEILPPAPEGDDNPAAAARRMAKAAVASAMGALDAARREAIASLDETIDESLFGARSELPPEAAADFKALAEDMRTRTKERMAERSLMLADALQRAAICDIATADAAVGRIRAAVARARKDPASGR